MYNWCIIHIHSRKGEKRMLNFITGVKGSGKTSLAHKITGEAVSAGKSVMLIVPRQFSFETDRSILSLLGPRLASETEVYSFSRLCDEVVKNHGGTGKPIATEGVKNILMSLAVEAVGDSLTAFSKHRNDIALSRKLLLSIEEMKNSGISSGELSGFAKSTEDVILREKMRETSLVYDAYDTLLSKDFFDEANLFRYVAQVLAQTDYFKGKTVIIDGYSEFSFGELKIIEQILIQAEQVYITLCIDNPENTDTLSPFAIVAKTYRRLRLLAGNNGVPIGERQHTERQSNYPADLDFLQENIFLPSGNKYEAVPDNIRLSIGNTMYSECDRVAAEIKALIRRGEYRCRDIAVVFRSEGSYEKALRLSMKKYGVPLFEDKRQPIWNQPLVCFVTALLGIYSEGFSTDGVFRYLKTGLTAIEEKDISELENYVYVWDIDGNRWMSDFTGNPDGFGIEMDAKRKERLEKINALRESVVAPLVSFREQCEGAGGKETASAVYFFLTENKIDEQLKKYALSLEEKGLTDLALEQEQVWDFLMESLNELAETVGDRHITPKRFAELFEICMQSKSLGKIPDGFDEVSLCPAQRILTKNQKVVFAVGLNSDIFPMKRSEAGIFSRREKMKMVLGGIEGFSDSEDAVLFERFLAYNTFCCATEKLYLSYSLTDPGENNLSRSEFVEAVQGIFPLLRDSYTAEADMLSLIESKQSAFEMLAKNWSVDDPRVRSLRTYFEGEEEYADRISSIKEAVGKRNLSFRDSNIAKEFFGKKLYFSATQLDDYGDCPFKYFCRHSIKAAPREKAEFNSRQIGTAVHYVLEMMLKKYKGDAFLGLTDGELGMEINRLLTEYLETSLSGTDDKTERFTYLYFRMNKVIFDIAERLRSEFAESDFEPCDFELSINAEGDVPPFTVALDEGEVIFCGKIDRVDRLDADGKRYIRIVDYKTGKKKFDLNDVINGINMQMLLYLVSIWRNGKGEYESIIPSGVLYYPAKIEAVDTEREADADTRRRKRYLKTKMNGLLVEDEKIIRRMDKKAEGLFLPISYDSKTGAVKGNLISLTALEKLGKKMDGIIKSMGDSLHEGKVDARPLMGSGHTNTCEYCDYKEVCMLKKPNYRYIEKLKHHECIQQIMKEEE